MTMADNLLWYDAPARLWTDALPLGNGRLGAMVFGDPVSERLQINESTFWAGGLTGRSIPMPMATWRKYGN